MTTYFVSRHAGAVEWVRGQGYDAVVHVTHLQTDRVKAGDIVLGTLPVSLIAEICTKGARYYHLTLNTPPDMRGEELTPEQMDQFGAGLVEYTARRVNDDG